MKRTLAGILIIFALIGFMAFMLMKCLILWQNPHKEFDRFVDDLLRD